MLNRTQIVRNVAFWLSGMVGAFVAILGDITQKDTASAVVKIATTVNSTVQVSVPTLVWVAVLVALGVALSAIFEPTSKKMAFFIGASVIALIMTATPYKPLPSSPTDAPGGGDTTLEIERPFVPVSYGALLVPAQAVQALQLTISLTAPPEGQPGPVTLSVYDTGSGNKWQQTLNATPGETVKMSWDLPLLSQGRELMVRVESNTYQIENRSDLIQPGATQHSVDIMLNPSNVPQFLQRLLVPYKF
jgi:hypothetical protein